jgi:hypothetical protein
MSRQVAASAHAPSLLGQRLQQQQQQQQQQAASSQAAATTSANNEDDSSRSSSGARTPESLPLDEQHVVSSSSISSSTTAPMDVRPAPAGGRLGFHATGGTGAGGNNTFPDSLASSVANSMAVPTSAALLALGASGAGAGAGGESQPSEQSLAEREAALSSLLAASESAHAELSERMLQVYEAQQEKLIVLRQMEKTLSSQAGALLKRLQSEEAATSQLSAIIKRYKSEHKKLLAKIANPRWEIAHHYHMTCIEHQLGSDTTSVLCMLSIFFSRLGFVCSACSSCASLVCFSSRVCSLLHPVIVSRTCSTLRSCCPAICASSVWRAVRRCTSVR